MRRISLYVITSLVLVLTFGMTAGTAAAAPGDQLLFDPGAEIASGSTPTYWSSSSWSTGEDLKATPLWSTDHHGGTHSLRFDVTARPGDGDAKWSPAPVDVTAGTYYTFSDWYKSSTTTAVSVEYWIAGQDLNEDGTWANLFSGIAPAATWTQYRTGFTMPAGAVKAIFVHFIASVGYLETDDYAMIEQAAPPGYSSPIVSLTFDDGSQGFYDNALPVINAKGFKTTQYIPTGDLVNKDYSFMMTPTEISTLAQQGHEIGAHSITHPDLTTCKPNCPVVAGYPRSTLTSELQDSKSFLQKLPNVGTVTDFAYPFGAYDANVIAAEKTAGYVSGRSVEEGYNTKLDLEPYDIRVQNILGPTKAIPAKGTDPAVPATPGTTLADFAGWVNYAKAHNYWLVIVFHEVHPNTTPLCSNPPAEDTDPDPCVGPFDTTVSVFQQMINYLTTAGVGADVMPVNQAFNSATSQLHSPVAGTAAISPTAPATNAILTAAGVGFTDPDNDPLTYTYQWSVNGTAIAGATTPTFDLSATGHGDHGDVVTVAIVASDPAGHKSATVTGTVTVANTVPVKGTVAITPSPPTAGAKLTATPSAFTDADNDPLAYHYQWSVKGIDVAAATDQTFTPSAVHGDKIAVTVWADDGQGGSTATVSATTTVINTAPIAGSVAITPSPPTARAQLTATPAGFIDADNDTLIYHYQWSVKDADVADATGKTFTPSAAHGDKIAVRIWADDGQGANSATVSTTTTVANTAPTAGSVAITPSPPTIGATLTATPTGFTDADSDPLSYHYQWSVNDADVQSATDKTFSPSAAHGDKIAVRIWADDGQGASTATVSDTVKVGNLAPIAGTVAITPSPPKAGTALTATPTGFIDPDGDPLSYHYQWSVKGIDIPAATDKAFTPSAVHGDKIAVTVWADDGQGGSTATVSATTTVINTTPIAGTVAIDPPSPTIGTTLTAKPAGFSDADNDPPNYHYQWSVKDADVQGATGKTFTPSAVHGDKVAVRVWADDGQGASTATVSATTTVVNLAPVKGKVTITPTAPAIGATLTAKPTEFTDADSDPLSYHYQWSVKGTDIPGATTETFTPSAARGDNVVVTVWADDGQGAKTDSVSDTVTVGNRAPVKGSVAITPSSPTAGTALTATPTGFTDPDGDTLSYSYQWSLNGTTIAGQTSATLPGSAVPAGQIGVQVTATDKPGASSEAASATITVSAPPAIDTTAPTILIASPAAKAYRLGQKLPVSYSCTDPAGIASCTATLARVGSSPGNVTSGQNVTPATAGHYLLSITAKDRAGNSNTATVAFTVTDTAAPTILITSPKAKTYRIGQKLQIKYFCTDISGIASYTATLARDRTKPGKISSGKTIRLTKTGRYTLKITATDHNGNTTTKTLKFKAK